MRKVLVLKPMVCEVLEGSVILVSDRQYEYIKDHTEEVIEEKAVTKAKKQTRKAK